MVLFMFFGFPPAFWTGIEAPWGQSLYLLPAQLLTLCRYLAHICQMNEWGIERERKWVCALSYWDYFSLANRFSDSSHRIAQRFSSVLICKRRVIHILFMPPRLMRHHSGGYKHIKVYWPGHSTLQDQGCLMSREITLSMNIKKYRGFQSWGDGTIKLLQR